jgi:hypothetical protein
LAGKRAALVAIFTLQQRSKERFALNGFVCHTLVDKHRLDAAAFGAGSEEGAVGVAQRYPRQLRFFSCSCCLPGALQRFLIGLIQLAIGRLILRGRTLVHLSLIAGVGAFVRQRMSACQQAARASKVRFIGPLP